MPTGPFVQAAVPTRHREEFAAANDAAISRRPVCLAVAFVLAALIAIPAAHAQTPGLANTTRHEVDGKGTPPPNDDCPNAEPIFPDTPIVRSTFGATDSDMVGCFFEDGADVFHSFTPDIDGVATLSTCETGTDFDTTLAV
ncbi:MAG: hypothetical protein AAB353_09935, partial [Candidatus Hydrogenedentota bacterium]